MPVKVYDRIKKDIIADRASQEDYDKMRVENDFLKSRVTSLVLETQAQAREIWELKHEMSEMKAIVCATLVPGGNDAIPGHPLQQPSLTSTTARHDVTTHTATGHPQGANRWTRISWARRCIERGSRATKVQ